MDAFQKSVLELILNIIKTDLILYNIDFVSQYFQIFFQDYTPTKFP